MQGNPERRKRPPAPLPEDPPWAAAGVSQLLRGLDEVRPASAGAPPWVVAVGALVLGVAVVALAARPGGRTDARPAGAVDPAERSEVRPPPSGAVPLSPPPREPAAPLPATQAARPESRPAARPATARALAKARAAPSLRPRAAAPTKAQERQRAFEKARRLGIGERGRSDQ
jgi:hypothetical protein